LEQRRSARVGIAYALAAIGVWGFIPILYKILAVVAPGEVLAHRVLWSLAVVLPLCAIQDRGRALLGHLRDRRSLVLLAVTAALIASNWMGFIVAVNTNQVLQSSLGYFISPLLSVAMGIVLLRERLSWTQGAAFALAAVGVLNHAVAFGAPPWIALWLAASFALYSYLRKITHAEALEGLTVEMLWLSPLAIVYVVWLGGAAAFGPAQPGLSLALILAGVSTSLPLVWFTVGARRLRLATVGFLQFLSPSIQFLLAVLYFGESFVAADFLTFGCIWLAIALYMWPRSRPLAGA
jgi:chloramphenicol-sensitive protein RarD